jgi:hypothetical protein
MRFLSKVAVASLLALGFATASRAQAPINPLLPTTGTREIELRGNFVFEPEDAYDVTAGYGPFLNPNFQVKGTVQFSGNGSDAWSLGAEGNYHFPGPSPTLPYLGLFLGYTDSEGGDGDISWGAQGGVKHFLNSSVAFTGSLVYRNVEDSEDAWGIVFGLAFYLR